VNRKKAGKGERDEKREEVIEAGKKKNGDTNQRDVARRDVRGKTTAWVTRAKKVLKKGGRRGKSEEGKSIDGESEVKQGLGGGEPAKKNTAH